MGHCFHRARAFGLSVLLSLTMLVLTSTSVVAAQALETTADPWRVMGFVSVGAPLRLTRRADLGQTTFAPVFIDTTASLLLPGQGAFRHGPVIGMSTNLTIDGGFYAPVDPLAQWVALVGYGAAYRLSGDLHTFAHLGVPFDLGPSGSVGVELSGTFAYRVLSGFGAFGAWSIDMFGAEGGLSSIAAIELGLFIDYEVLP